MYPKILVIRGILLLIIPTFWLSTQRFSMKSGAESFFIEIQKLYVAAARSILGNRFAVLRIINSANHGIEIKA